MRLKDDERGDRPFKVGNDQLHTLEIEKLRTTVRELPSELLVTIMKIYGHLKEMKNTEKLNQGSLTNSEEIKNIPL